MHARSRRLSLCLALATVMATGLSAADVVILNPAEIKGQVGFTPETLLDYSVSASSNDGLFSQKSFFTSPYSFLVESGHHYTVSLRADLLNETGDNSVTFDRAQPVLVDNQVGPTTAPPAEASSPWSKHPWRPNRPLA